MLSFHLFHPQENLLPNCSLKSGTLAAHISTEEFYLQTNTWIITTIIASSVTKVFSNSIAIVYSYSNSKYKYSLVVDENKNRMFYSKRPQSTLKVELLD